MRLALRSFAVIVGAAFALSYATAALAQQSQYSLEWNTPTGTPGSSGDFAGLPCGSEGAATRLFVTITPTEDITDLLAIDLAFDLTPMAAGALGSPIRPFWHFEEGGCNAGGLDVIIPSMTATGGMPTVFDASVAYSDWLYGPDYPAVGMGRVAALVIDHEGRGVNLAAGQTYVAFELDFGVCAAGPCEGCGDAFCGTPGYVRLGQESSDAIATPGVHGSTGFNAPCTVSLVRGSGAAATAARASLTTDRWQSNLGPAFKPGPQRALVCGYLPVQHRTWGTLKMLYR
jgi:hypothetical protein